MTRKRGLRGWRLKEAGGVWGNCGGAMSEWWGTRKARETDSGNVAERKAQQAAYAKRSDVLPPPLNLRDT